MMDGIPMSDPWNPTHLVAVTALLLVRGAALPEVRPVMDQLAPETVPADPAQLVAQIDSALAWVRANRPVSS